MLRFLTEAFELFLQSLQSFVRQVFKIDKFVSRAFDGADNLIEFKMHCFGIAVLSVLNQKHHQKRDDGGARINDQLPGVRKMKSRSGEEPHQNDQHRPGEGPSAPEHNRRTPGKDAKRIADYAKDISLCLVLFQFLNLGLLHDLRMSSQPICKM